MTKKELINYIPTVIAENNNKEITGSSLQAVLLDMVNEADNEFTPGDLNVEPDLSISSTDNFSFISVIFESTLMTHTFSCAKIIATKTQTSIILTFMLPLVCISLNRVSKQTRYVFTCITTPIDLNGYSSTVTFFAN